MGAEEAKEKADSDDSELDRDEEDDTDWLRHSMQQSMGDWKKQVDHRAGDDRGGVRQKVVQKQQVTGVRGMEKSEGQMKVSGVKDVGRAQEVKHMDLKGTPKRRIQKSDQLKKSPKSNMKKSENKSNDFTPQQIPIDEYYKMLNERLNRNEEDDKITFGNKCKNDFCWEDIKNKFINSDSESSANLGNNSSTPVSKGANVDEVTKRSSLKNNFMENNEDASLFNKFKKFKDNQPKAIPQQVSKPPIAKRDVSKDKIRANEAAKKLAQQKKNVRGFIISN